MKTNTIELYIHIPFCKSKCRYCDFCSFRAEERTIHAYLGKLKEELIFWGKKLAARDVVTVFIGGGTPSYLRREDIQMICETIFEHFHICEDAEITIEANPGTVDLKKLCTYRENGINRISFGLQSTVKEELEYLGRIHTYEEFLQSFDWARQAGFLNINVDLMSAVPKQTLTSYEENLRKIAKLSPEHISAYSLIIEDGTRFYEDNKLEDLHPSEDDEVLMYRMTEKILNEYGYDKYEISNYAVSGQESRHNLVYWHYLPYLSFGSSACSFNGSQRFTATDSVTDYIESIQSGKSCGGFEDLTKEMQLSEYLFMGLRTTVGIDLIETEQRFGCDVMLEFGVELEKFIRGNLVFYDIEHRRMRLTEQGMRFSNEIFEIFVK